MVTINIEVEGASKLRVTLEQMRARLDKALSRGIRKGTVHLTTVYKRDVLSGQVLKRRSGNLSRAIFASFPDPTTGVVGVGKEAPYAEALEKGARPHFIFPRPGTKALAFVPGGVRAALMNSGYIGKGLTSTGIKRVSLKTALRHNTVFARGVAHPGNPPFRFMEIGLRMATPEIRSIIGDEVNAAVNPAPDKPTAEWPWELNDPTRHRK